MKSSKMIVKKEEQYLPSNASLLAAGYHLSNKDHFETVKGGHILDDMEGKIQAVSSFLFQKENYEVLKVKETDLTRMDDSLQRLYWYLLIQLATNYYKEKVILDLKHYFEVTKTVKQNNSVMALLGDLDVLGDAKITYVGLVRENGKPVAVESKSHLLSYRKISTPKGYLKRVEIIFGDWLKLAKEVEDQKSIKIETDFLSINQRKFPFAKTFFIKLRERWRFNRQNRKESKSSSEKLSLQSILEASGEWEELDLRIKKRGLSGKDGVLTHIEKRLVHLTEYGVKWEWEFFPETKEDLEKVNIIYSMDYDKDEATK